MITEKDLQEAIAECQGKRNPDANTCIKLAAYYTIKNELYPEFTKASSFSYAQPPVNDYVDYQSGSEFSRAVDGKKSKEMWGVMDELMDALYVVNPRLYDSVMRKLH